VQRQVFLRRNDHAQLLHLDHERVLDETRESTSLSRDSPKLDSRSQFIVATVDAQRLEQ
jgi:hypothetical protein